MHGGWSCRDVVWANENRGLGGQKVKQGDQRKELLSGLVVEGLSARGFLFRAGKMVEFLSGFSLARVDEGGQHQFVGVDLMLLYMGMV